MAISIRCMCALLMLLCASTATALSPRLSLRQYQHTAWTEAGGQPLPALYSFAQTRDGYLWLATSSGHLRFDGLRFSEWTLAAGHSLPAGPARSVAVARDGAVWIATRIGLSRFQGGRVQQYPFDWNRATVNAMVEDASGAIWTAVETEGSAFLQALAPADGSVRRFGPAELPTLVRAIRPDGEGFWVGGENGVCRWTPGSAASCRAVPGAVQALAPDGTGAVFAATATAIYRATADRIETVVGSLPPPGIVRPGRLLRDRHGNLWAGATGGVVRVRNGSVETFTRKDGLSGEVVVALLEDAEGDIWIATNNGIDRFRDPRVLHLSTLDGLSGESVTAVKGARDGSVWVGTYGDGLNRIQGSSVTRYSTAEGLPGSTVGAIEEDSMGRLWVAGTEGLARFEKGRFVRVPLALPGPPVYALAADPRGGVWAAGDALWRAAGRVAVPVAAGQPVDIFRVLASRGGTVWLGSFAGGLRSLPPSGLPTSAPIAGLSGDPPRALLEDPSGALWVAAGAKLNRVRHGAVTAWGAAQGLDAGEIYGVTADRRGNLWLATVTAVLRVALVDLEKSRDGDALPVRFVRYDIRDGFRPADRGDMASPRITTAADGRVWVCERDGVGILDPDLLCGDSAAPPVVIEQLSADGVPLLDPEPRFRGRQLQIAYTANSLTAPERVRFRYRLQGVGTQWTEAEGRREVTYVDLGPGSYSFQVAACNLDGVCSEAGASAAFRVMPFYYQTVWFKFALSGAAWAIMWGGYKLRMRQVVARYQLVAQERARLTREIHDSLLQGFAGVVMQLDAASRQFETNPAASKERLDRALDQADESLREARQMLLDLRLPVLEDRTLSEALEEVGEAATRGTPIAFHLKVRGTEKPLPYAAQAALYLIGREAIRNAVSHAGPNRITASLAFEERECRLQVQDDGCGFDFEAAQRKEGHLGVRGMRERAREAGAAFHIESAPGAGATVEVVAPRKGG